MGATRLADGGAAALTAGRPPLARTRMSAALPIRPVPLYLQDDSHPQTRFCAACEVWRSALLGAPDAASLERIHAYIAAPHLVSDERVFGCGDPGSAVHRALGP
jgi:hypothetical protein